MAALPSIVACQSLYQFSDTSKCPGRGSVPSSAISIRPGVHLRTVARTDDAGNGRTIVSAETLAVSENNAMRSNGKRGSITVATTALSGSFAAVSITRAYGGTESASYNVAGLPTTVVAGATTW